MYQSSLTLSSQNLSSTIREWRLPVPQDRHGDTHGKINSFELLLCPSRFSILLKYRDELRKTKKNGAKVRAVSLDDAELQLLRGDKMRERGNFWDRKFDTEFYIQVNI